MKKINKSNMWEQDMRNINLLNLWNELPVEIRVKLSQIFSKTDNVLNLCDVKGIDYAVCYSGEKLGGVLVSVPITNLVNIFLTIFLQECCADGTAKVTMMKVECGNMVAFLPFTYDKSIKCLDFACDVQRACLGKPCNSEVVKLTAIFRLYELLGIN